MHSEKLFMTFSNKTKARFPDALYMHTLYVWIYACSISKFRYLDMRNEDRITIID